MLTETIARLRAWIRDFGAEKQPPFIRDLEEVLAAAEQLAAVQAELAKLKTDWNLTTLLAELGALREDNAELSRLNNLDVLRLQFPSGSVPENIEQGVRGWKEAYDVTWSELRDVQAELNSVRAERDSAIESLDANWTTHQQIIKAREELADARRRLLTAAGDDLCRLSQEEIKAMSAGAVKIPPEEQFIASCRRFHQQMAGEVGVNDNCLTLAQLVAENEKLRAAYYELRDGVEAAKSHYCNDWGEFRKSWISILDIIDGKEQSPAPNHVSADELNIKDTLRTFITAAEILLYRRTYEGPEAKEIEAAKESAKELIEILDGKDGTKERP